jgi:hypothetical protein
MKDWIEQNIDPPGMEKKNRGSLYSAIGKVFGLVREDAEKAFKAHFPYLADPLKLREHGKSLDIPEFPHDREDEFRERVSAAAFFLARAGERAFIHQQLERHFGNQYNLTEKFLEVSVKIPDAGEDDFVWLWNFFDEILDPNIRYTIEELFDFLETMLVTEEQSLKIDHKEYDSFAGIKYNGHVKYDGNTINQQFSSRGKYNGVFNYDGSLSYSGIGKLLSKRSYSPPFKYSSGIIDRLSMLSAMEGHEGTIETDDFFNASMRYHHSFNGAYRYDGDIKYNSNHPYGIELSEEA